MLGSAAAAGRGVCLPVFRRADPLRAVYLSALAAWGGDLDRGAGVARRGAALPLLGMLAAAVTAGIGFYHAGVELGWFAGLATCTVDTLQGVVRAIF